MLIPILLFLLGFVMLIKGGDWFVDGATGIARRFHIPEIIVGATVVSIGTTLPEVMVSVQGALGGQGAVAYGNAIGSIICNTSLIAAITVTVHPSVVDTKSLKLPVIFFVLASAIYLVATYAFGYFYSIIGIILLLVFGTYMFLTVRQGLKKTENSNEIISDDSEESVSKPRSLVMEIIMLVVGAAVIAVGADLLIDNGTIIAKQLGVPETVIALTFVALGTSLPELITAITALIKGHHALSLGNILGANLFNLVLVSGASIALAPFKLPVGNTIFGYNSSLVLDVPLMLVVMAILVVPTLLKKKLSRWQGILLLCLYAGFCTLQFVL